MRIGTWNLEHAAGDAKNAARGQRLRDAACDVWVLTETHTGISLGPDLHCTSTTGRSTGRAGSHWTSIWSRYPVLQVLPTSDPHRTVAALFQAPDRPLVVYGTVLPWGADPGPSGVAKGWTEHHRVIEEQVAEWNALRSAHPDASFCIAGDFNTNLAGAHYYGTARGRSMLRKAFSDLGLTCVTAQPSPALDRLQHPPIDHICLDTALARTARVIDTWDGTTAAGMRLSDHSALVIET